jgi:glutamate racemase
VKFLVVACNTVSAVALDILRVELDIPVLGVIEPGARAGLRATLTGRIGVIATAGTVQSGAYERAVRAGDSRAEVVTQAAPLLVPLVEEGWVEGDVPRLAVRRYLEPLVEAGIDALILGCTHYPVLRACIQNELDALGADEVVIVDSAAATAQELGDSLAERGLMSQSSEQRRLRVMVTDTPGTFLSAASRFLGSDAEKLAVEGVDL